MFTQKNNLNVWVGKSVSATAAATLIDNYSDLNDTEIALIDITTNKTIQNAASIEWVRFVYRNGTQLIYSPIMKGAKMIRTKTMQYVAPKEQISYVGWNGTSGALEVQNSKLYLLKVNLVDAFTTFGNKIMYKTLEYKSDATATQAEIADGLYASFLANYSNEVEDTIKVERIAAGTSLTALTGSSTVNLLTNGSKTVSVYIKTADGTATYTASTASVTAGDVLQFPSTDSRTFSFTTTLLGTGAGHGVLYIGGTSYLLADAGTAAQNATALVALINAGTQATAVAATALVTITLNPGVTANVVYLESADDSTWTNVVVTNSNTVPVVYKAAATTSAAATFELDQPWAGATGYAVDGTAVGSTSGVLTATGAYGLKFTGLARTNFQAGVFRYLKNRFKLAITVGGEASSSTITYSQVASEGQGAYEQIATLEWFAAGNRLNYGNRDTSPGDTPFTARATSGKTYECLSFTLADDNDVVTLTGASPKSLTEFIFAFEKDSAQGDQMITSANTIVGMTDFAAFA